MNCPYCQKRINAFTGLQELQKFGKHLVTCRKNPANIVLTDGKRTVVTPIRTQGIEELLEIRASSGQ